MKKRRKKRKEVEEEEEGLVRGGREAGMVGQQGRGHIKEEEKGEGDCREEGGKD